MGHMSIMEISKKFDTKENEVNKYSKKKEKMK